MPTTARRQVVARHASLLKDQIRRGRAHTTEPQTDPYVVQLSKDILSREDDPRRKGVEQTLEILLDIARRGAIDDAEAACFLMLSMVREEYREAHPERSGAGMSVREAHIAEEVAEGECEALEAAMAHEPTLSNKLAYLTARAKHLRAIQQLDDAVRASVVGPEVAR